MMRDSASVKLRWALSSGTLGCSLPSSAACSASARASASKAAMASLILSNRPSRKDQLRRQLITAPVLPVPAVLLLVHLLGPTQQLVHLTLQLRFLLFHPLIAHGLVLRRIRPHLGVVQRHVAQLDQPLTLAKHQHLQEQP